MEMDWMMHMDYWHWWVLGISLAVLEILSPAAFFLWMGIAAGLVGLLLLIMPSLGWEAQLLFFSLFSVGSIIGWRAYLKRYPTESDHPKLNRRGEQYVGRTFTLDEPVVNGKGKVKVDDSTWKIEGEDCAAGTRIRVVGVEGVIFKIEPLP
jgi:hypothetical protein